MKCTRREFLHSTTAVACGITLASCAKEVDSGLLLPRENTLPAGLIVATGSEPQAMLRAAINELGGLSNLIQKGDTVLVKPNIAFDRTPEQAANTNPDLVGEMVKLVVAAGAGEVVVLDHTLAKAQLTYERSGIAAAAKEAGARVVYVRGKTDPRFRNTVFPEGKITKSWGVHSIVRQADVFINMPIVKHHVVARATVGLKNLMGLAGGNRGEWHTNLADRICDINQRVRVDLTVVDGFRVLARNGPTGGNLKDVVEKRTIAVSTDRVAVDAFGVTLLDMDPNDIPAIAEAARRGMGQIDLAKVDVQNVSA